MHCELRIKKVATRGKRRFSRTCVILFVLIAGLGNLRNVCAQLADGSRGILVAELTEQQKRQLFLKSRDQMRSLESAPTPTPQSKPNATPVSRPSVSPAPQRSSDRSTPRMSPIPRSSPSTSPRKSTATALPSSMDSVAPARVIIEKSGKQEDTGLQPLPSRSLRSKRWKYLTPAVRRQIDSAKVRKGRWKYIIIHNSGTRQGNAKSFDNYHRRVRKMQHGLAYHFVIGNGVSSGNGEIEVGPRWTKQINGGHVASDYLNNIAIGICLVGDFNSQSPNRVQMEALRELITYLRIRAGKFKGKQLIVRGHKEINPKPTDCPGRKFPLSWVRSNFK